MARLAIVLSVTLAAWVVYVPSHELLHALGCAATGGDVRELQIRPLYGGALLSRVFPFVRVGADYAGRLTGFDTRGSDLVYLATDLAPFSLTVVGAFPLLVIARARRSPWFLGPGLVLAAAPLMSLNGDLYEMGSIVVTSVFGALPWGRDHERLLRLRHDDLVLLLKDFGTTFSDHHVFYGSAIALAAAMGWLLGNAILLAARTTYERIVRLRAARARVV